LPEHRQRFGSGRSDNQRQQDQESNRSHQD
jgi:hypothetical protein